MKQSAIGKLFRNFSIALGILLVWRGIWYLFDIVDERFFGGDHAATAIGGILAGLLILYLPDRDLKELGKL
ncbi:MAG: hypothetical protein WC787_01260 [Patescibacteria group bacterium]|jgi:hypothetical protein